jgi:hypothetical protein
VRVCLCDNLMHTVCVRVISTSHFWFGIITLPYVLWSLFFNLIKQTFPCLRIITVFKPKMQLSPRYWNSLPEHSVLQAIMTQTAQFTVLPKMTPLGITPVLQMGKNCAFQDGKTQRMIV